jgi:hypothetical protein
MPEMGESFSLWLIGILVSLVFLLAGWGYADHQRRLTKLEDHVDEHDRWAGIKAEELATVKQAFLSILQRLDRQDGLLDTIRSDLGRIAERITGRRNQ